GGKRPAGVLPYKIYEVNGKKIAVIGLGQDIRAATQKVKFTKGRKELKKALKEIKKNGADAVVLLAHLPFADNEHQKPVILGNITKKLSGINLALGGHTHKVIQGAKIGDIYYVESGTELRGVSRVALKFNDETGKLENITSQYIELDADKTGRDEAVKAYAQNIAGAALETVLGQAKEDIKKLNPNPKEAVDSPLGNLFADMIRNIAKTDIAMQNTGGVRRDIPAGPVTQRLAAEVFPFPNTIVTMRVNGAFIRKTAQDSLAEQSSLFQYSGLALRYKYEDGKPVITQIKIQGRDLDDKKMYTLAINDYNAAGNSEGYMFKNLKNKTPLGSKGIAQYFTEYLQANPGGIYAAQTGRIVREY
ncbi:MAG: 5'-nucleotidase C-terminal domain-containing protein, partial [Elusimicrobiota bacterium]|nr:5'-nucleotidase C-terminal domain-containing protein [Elusimicrobiota bacterium]